MTDETEYEDLNSFLSEFKVDKGEEYTHTSMGRPAGCYNIPLEHYDTFTDLLYQACFVDKKSVHLTEKPPQETIVKADFDFRFDLSVTKRQFTDKHVRNIIELYHNAINHYLEDVDPSCLQAFVFKRQEPYKYNDIIKDGIHIMYPYVICDTQIQHLIREHVILHIGDTLTEIQSKNPLEDIIDKAVISTNNWLMYGCCKPYIQPYLLSEIYKHDLSVMPQKEMKTNFPSKNLVKLLSIRNIGDRPCSQIKPDLKYLLDKVKQGNKSKKNGTGSSTSVANSYKVSNIINVNRPKQDLNINLEDVKELVYLLDKDRAEHYDTWIEVGLCLHNIDNSLLETWIEFSKQSPKFQIGECDKTWSNFVFKEDGLSISSLHRWAKNDNPSGYAMFTRNNLQKDILKSQSMTTQDVAKVIYNMYKYEYKCTSIKGQIWYEFSNHRWRQIDSAVSLRHKIGNQVVDQYLRLIAYFNSCAHEAPDEQKDQLIQKAKNLTDVTYKLRDCGFKDKLIKECAVMFYDGDFENKLDLNADLIGFENGVYDLERGEFREGRPEDAISLSTNNNYKEYDINSSSPDPLIVEIMTFLNQVFPDDDRRHYVILKLSSYLEGRNPKEQFDVWSGVGSNGKSKLLELFELAFGKYASKIPVSTLTQARASGGSANPEIARLKGIRLVSTQEPEEGEKFNIGILKDWTGGDRITCRELYGRQFDFKPQFKMLFCCNHLPALPADDTGCWRRIRLVEFLSRFIEKPNPDSKYEFKRDLRLTDKLHKWKEAFMFLLLATYRVYKKHGITEPPCVLEATINYQKQNDAYVDFVNDFIKQSTDPDHKVSLNDSYSLFKQWWKSNNPNKVPSSKDFKVSLDKKLGKYNINKKGWVGYTLVDPQQSNDDDNNDNNDVNVNDNDSINTNDPCKNPSDPSGSSTSQSQSPSQSSSPINTTKPLVTRKLTNTMNKVPSHNDMCRSLS